MNRYALIGCAVAAMASAAQAQFISDLATLEALLGGGGTLEEFEKFDIGDGNATNLDIASLDENSIANGQGPGLVKDGASYNGSSVLQWNGNNYFGLQTKTILSNSGDGLLTIKYDTPVQAMGLDLLAFDGFGDDSKVSVFDPNGNLLDSAGFFVAGSKPVFMGYQGKAIGSVQIQGSNPWSTIIDNHLFGSVPAPSAAALLGLAGIAAARRRR